MPIFHPHAKTCTTSPLYSESCNFSSSNGWNRGGHMMGGGFVKHLPHNMFSFSSTSTHLPPTRLSSLMVGVGGDEGLPIKSDPCPPSSKSWVFWDFDYFSHFGINSLNINTRIILQQKLGSANIFEVLWVSNEMV